MNTETLRLKDLIYVEKEFIPKDICKFVIDEIQDKSWSDHLWYNHNKRKYTKNPDELTYMPIPKSLSHLEDKLNPLISKSLKLYHNFLGREKVDSVSKFSPIRFNRYELGQSMDKHFDHILDLFEGEMRGIPVLSVIINFNNNYDGGDLIFWDDYKIDLGEGDVVIFPSLFLFPHRVEPVTKNIRYSGVCWCCC